MNPSGDFLSGARIVLVEDDGDIARLIVQTLSEFGFQTTWCKRAAEFRARLKIELPDLALIDLGLPDVDGMALVRELRESDDCGIIVITGRRHSGDRIMGLEDGADDYVTKPFDSRELVARVRSVLRRYARRTGLEAASRERWAEFIGWRFFPATNRLVAPDGDEHQLSNAEANLLQVFLEKANRILTREQLLGERNISPFDRSIDVRISRLRRKLESDPQHPKLIKTVYGAGYLFAASVVWSADA